MPDRMIVLEIKRVLAARGLLVYCILVCKQHSLPRLIGWNHVSNDQIVTIIPKEQTSDSKIISKRSDLYHFHSRLPLNIPLICSQFTAQLLEIDQVACFRIPSIIPVMKQVDKSIDSNNVQLILQESFALKRDDSATIIGVDTISRSLFSFCDLMRTIAVATPNKIAFGWINKLGNITTECSFQKLLFKATKCATVISGMFKEPCHLFVEWDQSPESLYVILGCILLGYIPIIIPLLVIPQENLHEIILKYSHYKATHIFAQKRNIEFWYLNLSQLQGVKVLNMRKICRGVQKDSIEWMRLASIADTTLIWVTRDEMGEYHDTQYSNENILQQCNVLMEQPINSKLHRHTGPIVIASTRLHCDIFLGMFMSATTLYMDSGNIAHSPKSVALTVASHNVQFMVIDDFLWERCYKHKPKTKDRLLMQSITCVHIMSNAEDKDFGAELQYYMERSSVMQTYQTSLGITIGLRPLTEAPVVLNFDLDALSRGCVVLAPFNPSPKVAIRAAGQV